MEVDASTSGRATGTLPFDAWLRRVEGSHCVDATGADDFAQLAREVHAATPALARLRPEPRHGEPYGRLLLHRSARGEVMLAGWNAGGRSAPHDHGGASGAVFLLEGTFVETSFVMREGRLLPTGAIAHGKRAVLPVHADPMHGGPVHDLEATTRGLTLHFYAPPISGMRVYDVETQTVYVVSDDCGAWIPGPGDAGSIVTRRSFDEGVS